MEKKDDFNIRDEAIEAEVVPEPRYKNTKDVGKLISKNLMAYNENQDPDDTEDSSEIVNFNVDQAIQESYKDFIESYHLSNLNYKNYQQLIKDLVDYNSNQSDFNKLYRSKLVCAVSDKTTINAIMALGCLIQKALEKAIKISKKNDPISYASLVETIQRVFKWINELEKLKAKYHIVGTEHSLANMSKEENSIEETKLSNENFRMLVEKVLQAEKKAENIETNNSDSNQ